MNTLDTDTAAELVQLDSLRRLGHEGRLKAALQIMKMSRELLTEGIRHRHPEYDEERVKMAYIRLTLPPVLFQLAYPDQAETLP